MGRGMFGHRLTKRQGYKSPSTLKAHSRRDVVAEKKIRVALKKNKSLGFKAFAQSAKVSDNQLQVGEVKESKASEQDLCAAPNATFKPRGEFWKKKMAKL